MIHPAPFQPSNPQPPPKKNFPTSFLPLVSKGMSSQLPGVSAGHLYTAPALSTPGCPDSALGAPTNSLQKIRGKGKCGIREGGGGGYILFPTSPQGSSDLSHVSVLVFDRQPHIQFLEMVNTLSLIPSSIFALSIFHQANVSSHDCACVKAGLICM